MLQDVSGDHGVEFARRKTLGGEVHVLQALSDHALQPPRRYVGRRAARLDPDNARSRVALHELVMRKLTVRLSTL